MTSGRDRMMAHVMTTVLVGGVRRELMACECGAAMIAGFDHVCDPEDRPKAVVIPTAAEIDAAKTPRGGFTRETLAGWGVPWPPPRGWRADLVRRSQSQRRWQWKPQS